MTTQTSKMPDKERPRGAGINPDAALSTVNSCSSPFGTDRLIARHRTLIDTTLPLLSHNWQSARLVLGEDGRFPCPPGGRRTDAIEIDLMQADRPAIGLLAPNRIVLSYNETSLDRARSAFLASAAHGGWPIAGDEHSMALLTLAERISTSDIPVLLEGPTGTGKEVLARFVHRLSSRAKGPFVAVNCAAMPEAMLEGLLFGHRKGAFTGAAETREGLFRAADTGTLLLDEIGELPLALQAKLLRALQEGEVLPLGATTPVKFDVRIIACTNRQLAAEVSAGRFREDLLYRLNVFPLELAALRNRSGDIAPLAFGMLLRHAGRPGMPTWIEEEALSLLEQHAWPGNVRELENVIRRAVLLAGDAPTICGSHIVFDQPVRAVIDNPAPMPSPKHEKRSLSDVAFASEAQAILDALESHDGHRARTARSLGISERTLRYRLASMRANGLISAGARA
ncbi:sigma-54-dependent Fis family transcriptional regulator [Erythrobacter litoralis]|jgi:two-component system response regulator FlrC|nr:sigma 54-interacting transcriptional regulator [Erythrobacter litoralis]AOL22273.1 sigma-54-dependent Fis family transcriptional regulator [Erythrobacter litoralis]MEE4337404.1 sigma 54-interacting transcriptional regulator [Erythrobacter sp.]